MQLILLGAPGSGKGTIAEKLVDRFGLLHLSTGDAFRQAIRARTSLGIQIERTLKSGKLVSDELTSSLVEARLSQIDSQSGYLLDGFPRTLPQAQALDCMKPLIDNPLTAVIHLTVPDALIVARLSNRRVCSQCGQTYNLIAFPPRQPGICDVCGAPLEQREDDQEETILRRLAAYREQTEPLVAYYRARHLLVEADNQGPVDETFAAVLSGLSDLEAYRG